MLQEQVLFLPAHSPRKRPKAYYVGKNSSTYSFTLNFSKKEELPSHFYNVVEVPKSELNPKASKEELKRVVEDNAVASWTISGF
jgi:hypothetical protein